MKKSFIPIFKQRKKQNDAINTSDKTDGKTFSTANSQNCAEEKCVKKNNVSTIKKDLSPFASGNKLTANVSVNTLMKSGNVENKTTNAIASSAAISDASIVCSTDLSTATEKSSELEFCVLEHKLDLDDSNPAVAINGSEVKQVVSTENFIRTEYLQNEVQTRSSNSVDTVTPKAERSQISSISSDTDDSDAATKCHSAPVSRAASPAPARSMSRSRSDDPVTFDLSTNQSNSHCARHTAAVGQRQEEDEDSQNVDVASERPRPMTSSGKNMTTSPAQTGPSLQKLQTQKRLPVSVKVSNPVIAGEGTNTFLVFHVTTVTKLSKFPRESMTVQRSWRDFLSLHHKLAVKHEHRGLIVPPSPSHNIRGTFLEHDHLGLKIHLISAEELDKIFKSLERFLYLIVPHPMLRLDADFVEFVEREGHLEQDVVPRLPPLTSSSHLAYLPINLPITNDQHLIANSYMKNLHWQDEASLFIPLKPDYQWFQVRQHKYERMAVLLGRLAEAGHQVSITQKACAAAKQQTANSVERLAANESEGGVALVLIKVADVIRKVASLHHALANIASTAFTFYFTDCWAMVTAALRTEEELVKMRERLGLLEIDGHTTAVSVLEKDIVNTEELATSRWQDFNFMSTTLVSEVTQFDTWKLQEHRHCVINYLEVTLLAQFEILGHWELLHSLLIDLELSDTIM